MGDLRLKHHIRLSLLQWPLCVHRIEKVVVNCPLLTSAVGKREDYPEWHTSEQKNASKKLWKKLPICFQSVSKPFLAVTVSRFPRNLLELHTFAQNNVEQHLLQMPLDESEIDESSEGQPPNARIKYDKGTVFEVKADWRGWNQWFYNESLVIGFMYDWFDNMNFPAHMQNKPNTSGGKGHNSKSRCDVYV